MNIRLLFKKRGEGDRYTIIPSNRLLLNVDKQAVLEKGIIPAKKIDYLQDSMEFIINGKGFQ